MTNDKIPWATILMIAIAVIVVVVGGVVVILGNMTFQDYLDALEKFGIAVGVLGIGRGIHAGLTYHGKGTHH